MSVRKTAAKFEVNPSTDSVSPTLSRAPTTQASPARPRQISGPARPGQIKWSGPAASIGWNASRPGVSQRPLGGGRAKIENSSRRHPRKFGQKRFLAVRRSWRGKWSGLFLGNLLGKNFRRRDRDHLTPPRRMDAAVCRAEACYPFGREHGGHRAVRRREFITLLGGGAAAYSRRARIFRRAPRAKPARTSAPAARRPWA